MKPVHYQAARYYRILIAIGGLGFLIYGSLRSPQTLPDPAGLLLLALLAGFLVQYPINLFLWEFTLVPIIALGYGLIVGAVPVAWATTLGVVLGYIFRWLVREKRSWRRLLRVNAWMKVGFSIGLLALPLSISFLFTEFAVGIFSAPELQVTATNLLLPVSLFILSNGLLFFVGFLTQQRPASYSKFRLDFSKLLTIEILAIPFVILIVESFPFIEGRALLLLGGIPGITAYLLHKMDAAQIDHERRVRELSTLNHISNTLQSTLDLDELLPVIQQQVMQLLEVNNFYVALYDRETEQLWYPLAIKFGQEQHWPRRETSDRLTDRVIHTGKAILLTAKTQPLLAPVGLPPSEENPTSWLGVPLISSEQTIGCLAVFSMEPGATFSLADQDVLTILSGQVSLAIENALLYQQSQERARQLETLNQLTGAITASLDLEEVLSQVCNAVAQVIGSQRSAVFLLDIGKDTVSLAFSHGLEPAFGARNTALPIADSRRTLCLRTGKPAIFPELEEAALSFETAELFQSHEIQAFADFPLITPDGQIGFLSVYYKQKHTFSPEEIGILQTLASQAALAVANARLHARTDAALARRVNQLTTLEAVGRELSAATHSDRLFRLILNYALEMTNSCCGTVVVYETDTQKMVVQAVQGYDTPPNEFPLESGITGRVGKTGQTANIGEVSEDPDFIALRTGDTRSQLSVPLIHENRIMGVITLESPEPQAYSESEEAFVTQLANQAAIAIVNADYFHEATHGRDRLAAILNSIEEGILLIDIDGRVLLANEPIRILSGFPLEAFIDSMLFELPDEMLKKLGYTQPEITALLESLGRMQAPIAPKATYETRDAQRTRMIERVTAPVWGQDRTVIGWMVLIRDITEEYEIEQTREAITQTVVHDLRSPMSAIVGALEILSECLVDEEDPIIQQALLVAQRSANRVLALTEALLDIARLQSGRMVIEDEPIQLSALVSELLAEFTTLANDDSVIIRSEIPTQLPVIRADRDKLIRVLTNLVDNAIKFSPEGGTITISAEPAANDRVAIKVKDSGPGVPLDYQEKIFERFVQVPGQRSRRRGTGLGLAFCRLTVEAHGGRIWVESPPEGGSIFTFTLPVDTALEGNTL